MELRAPLVPEHVGQLTTAGINVEIISSRKRVFPDAEYERRGARVVHAFDKAELILGVKEMPIGSFEKDKVYVFFSHTIKGQAYNMPLLKDLMQSGANLVDYERIANEKGQRLIFFGRYAGIAGMINSLWSLGQRLKAMGKPNPFEIIRQSHQYADLEEARHDVEKLAKIIERDGIPEELHPLTVGITGYGNVSRGAQEILDILPVETLSPEQLLEVSNNPSLSRNKIYKTVFREEDLSRRKDGSGTFDLNEYYTKPELFENQFDAFVPRMTMLMNCMYWDDRYPRIVTKAYLKSLSESGENKLLVIGDITCDPDGSIECTHEGTLIEDPVFVYDPIKQNYRMGFEGQGVLVMAVDILPSELPREASQTFSDALIGFLPQMVAADYEMEFEELSLPGEIKRALIVHKGQLTPDYTYLEKYL